MSLGIKNLSQILQERQKKEDFLPSRKQRIFKNKKLTIIAAVDKEDKQLIEDIAFNEEISVSNLIRNILLRYIREYIVNLSPITNRQKKLKENGMERCKDEI